MDIKDSQSLRIFHKDCELYCLLWAASAGYSDGDSVSTSPGCVAATGIDRDRKLLPRRSSLKCARFHGGTKAVTGRVGARGM